MFNRNTLTLNPGWNSKAEAIDDFDDVGEIQKDLKSKGVKLDSEVDEWTIGPASLVLEDPDGKKILIDR